MKILLIVLLIGAAPGAAVAQVFIVVPSPVQVGDPLLVVFAHNSLDREVTARLVDSAGTVVADSGCFLIPESAIIPIYASLLGVPSTAVPGRYRLIVSGIEKQIEITAKQFLHEDISLTVALSDLRRSDDPQKVEESLALLRLLQQFDPEAYFHTRKHIIPVPESRETSAFGDRRRYLYTDQGEASAIHNGLDLAAPIGTPVHASGGGKVVFAGNRIITGNSIVLEHLPGLYGLYYHLDSLSVQTGDMVEQGAVLGTVGMTGLATGPHLHWELRASGVAVNPRAFIGNPLIDKQSIISMIDGKP